MDLSDLELVAQAMAPTEPPTSSPATPAKSTNGVVTAPAVESSEADPLASFDLSSLSLADREALQPIIDALRATSGEAGEGDLDIEEILNQLDAAGDVADNLEDRLDRLLANLGEVEGGLVEETDIVVIEKEDEAKA